MAESVWIERDNSGAIKGVYANRQGDHTTETLPEDHADVQEFRNPRSRFIIAERGRRLAAGFDYNFGDARGVHRIGTTDADRKGWDEVSTYAGALIDSADVETKINIVTDTGPCQVTAPEWRAIELAAAQFRQPIWAASFVLLASLPPDYADDRHWA